jgi:hypothetical protein
MSFLKKLAESIERPDLVVPTPKADEQSCKKKLETEAKEDAQTGGHKEAIVEPQETVTKVSAAENIEFYNKVGCALSSVKVKRKLKKFTK